MLTFEDAVSQTHVWQDVFCRVIVVLTGLKVTPAGAVWPLKLKLINWDFFFFDIS